ncbi:MAG: SapC family protein [Alphaproteobacteria bacterium]|nr:SapC family protein [Alphaproteobacteria bacterium]
MFKRLVPLSSTDHSKHLWTSPRSCVHARGELFVPIAQMETLALANEFPIVFGQTAAGYTLGILTGIANGQSAAVSSSGLWRGHYVPVAVRSAPFAILHKDPQTLAIMIDEESPLISKNTGNPIFEAESTIHKSLLPTIDLLFRWGRDRALLAPVIEAIVACGLLSRDLSLKLDDSSAITVRGVRMIDTEHVKRLSAKALVSLHTAAALELVYMSAASAASLPRLVQFSRENAQQQSATHSLLGPEWFG